MAANPTPMLLGARDRVSDTTPRDSAWRWTATSRSSDGMTQADRSPTTSGDAPPKTGTTGSGLANALKLLGAIAVYYYFTR